MSQQGQLTCVERMTNTQSTPINLILAVTAKNIALESLLGSRTCTLQKTFTETPTSEYGV